MQVTISQLIDGFGITAPGPLKKLAAHDLSAIPMHTLDRFLMKWEPEFKLALKGLDKLAAQYGEEVPDKPGMFRIPQEKCAAYNADLEAFGATEINVDAQPLDYAAFEAEGVRLSRDAYVALKPFLAYQAPAPEPA